MGAGRNEAVLLAAIGFGGDDTASIYSVGPDGSGLRRLTRASPDSGIHGEPACHEQPSVSPDGRLVVYTLIVSCFHGVGSSIAAVTAAGKPRKLGFRFAWPAPAIEPEYFGATWAPDGMRIAYGVRDYGS